MPNKDFSEMSWRTFFDQRRNTAFSSRANEKQAMADGTTFRHVGAEDGRDIYTYFGDEFDVPENSPRDRVFQYALYRDKVLDDGGEPTEYETPTKDGW